MLTQAQNDLITRVGPGAPLGRLMRRYWHPIALAEDLADPRPARAVRLLGQDLVLFRDGGGRLGLLDRHCPHRGADLAFGRLEADGLRCAFHGWLLDAEGRLLEAPAEPVGSALCRHVRQGAYPVLERAGMIWAYLGPGAPPEMPALDCFAAPDSHVFAFCGLIECNWLQALEVGIDPAHASFLHRFFDDEDPADAYGRQFRAASAGAELPMTYVLRVFDRPEIRAARSPIGMQLTTLRRIDDARTHVRVTNQLFPTAFVIPMSAEMTITQWHTPVDDETCYWFAAFTSFTTPVDKARMRAQRLELYQLPDYRSWRNRENNYGYDSVEQARETYTGMGHDINVHDQWAIESMGRIQDRTRETLASTDKAIALYRRILKAEIDAVADGRDPLLAGLDPQAAAALRGPATVDAVCPTEGWEDAWQAIDRARRAAAPWAAALPEADPPAPAGAEAGAGAEA